MTDDPQAMDVTDGPSGPSSLERLARLEALGKSLVATRKEAIDARLASGIETIWLEDEEHYEGVDDLNRGASRTAWQSKPPGRDNPRAPDVRARAVGLSADFCGRFDRQADQNRRGVGSRSAVQIGGTHTELHRVGLRHLRRLSKERAGDQIASPVHWPPNF